MATPPTLRKLGRAERALRPQNIAKQVDEIRSKVDEIIQALANLNTTVTGSASGTTPALPFGSPVGLTANSVLANGVSTDVPRADHVHSIASAAPSGGYGTTAAAGVGAGFARADDRYPYPDSLMATGTTKLVTLSDDATAGALLTAGNTFTANAMALKVPNATNTLRVGIYGNVAAGTSTLSDFVMLGFNNSYNESANTPQGMTFSITNSGNGAGGILDAGINAAITGTALNAGGATTRIVDGYRATMSAGNTTNTNFQGSVYSYRSISNSVTSSTIGTGVPLVCCFESSNINAFTRVAVTDLMHFRARGSVTLLTSATLTNHTGLRVEALAQGTNRYGVDIAAITGGTLAYGVQIATHSGGTTRRGLISGNTNESTANDFLTSTQGKGFIAKDAQGSPHYWRYTVATDGTPYIDDTGTTAPTT